MTAVVESSSPGHGGSLDEDLAGLAPLADLFADLPPAPPARPTTRSQRDADADWRHRARCTDGQALHDEGLSFEAFTGDAEERQQAAPFCEACPVARDCELTALAISQSYGVHGVWGGIDYTGRSAKWRQRRREALAAEDGEA